MAAELWRLQWGGASMSTLSGGTELEEWSCSLHAFSPLGGFSMSSITTAIVGLLQTYHTAVGTAICGTERLDYMKFNQIDITTGLQITDPTNVRYFTTGNRGATGGTAFPPLQISMRVTIDDGTRSRRSRGGYYLPRLGPTVDANAVLPSTTVDALATTTKTFLDGISGLADLSVGVYSRAGSSFTPSNRLRVGNVPDTIRRRRNSLSEVYTEKVLVP